MSAAAVPGKIDAVRAFVCTNLPGALRERLAEMQQEIKALLPMNCLRWTKPEQVHLTLRFLGNTPRAALPALQQALSEACRQCEPFHLRAEGFGCFPDFRRPRVLWLGVTGDLGQLRNLKRRVVEATASWGEQQPEEDFQPHLTLARIKHASRHDARRISEVLDSRGASALGDWLVESIELMQSVLGPEGAEHRCLATLPFRDAT
jgi:2'-5' RNA ligase